MAKSTFTVARTLSAADMSDILCTGFESGPYGSVTITGYGPKVPRKSDDPRYCSDPLNGGTVFVEDKYGDGEKGEINAETLQRGLDHLREHHPRMLASLLAGDYDVIPADALIQAAAFGSVIYG